MRLTPLHAIAMLPSFVKLTLRTTPPPEGMFHVWSVTHVGETIELLTGVPSGADAKNGKYPSRSVYGRVLAKLTEYDRLLTERAALRR